MTGVWSTCTVAPPNPEHWLSLDLEAERPQEWARAAAREELGKDAPAPLVKGLTEDLAWYHARARAEGAFTAAVYRPGPWEPITAFLHLCAFDGPESGDAVEQIERRFRAKRGYVLGEPIVSVVRLPAGRAVRVRELAGGPVEADASEVLEYVSHYVVPDGFSGPVISVTLTWGSLPLGEVFSDFADAVAQSLSVEPSAAQPHSARVPAARAPAVWAEYQPED